MLKIRGRVRVGSGLGLDPDALLEDDGSPSQSPTRAGGKSECLVLIPLFPLPSSPGFLPFGTFYLLYNPHDLQKSIQTDK